MRDVLSKQCLPVEISETDVLTAMKSIEGYLDITPGDFREIYQTAYALAVERLLSSLSANDLMTKTVHQISQDADLVQAASMLAAKEISGAPVVDETGKVVGVISEKDFLRRMGAGGFTTSMQIIVHCLENKGCMAAKLRNCSVAEIMSTPPVTASSTISAGAIAALFADRGINRLPIVDAKGLPVGIVTRTDLAHSYCIFG